MVFTNEQVTNKREKEVKVERDRENGVYEDP